jgi:hypothetical protein
VFWVISGAVAVVLFALAWWTSGRAKAGSDMQRGIDAGGAEGKSRSEVTRGYAQGPGSI